MFNNYYQLKRKVKEISMLSCATMKKNEIYMCKECGLEIKIVQECKECKEPEGSSASCCVKGCTFSCCGEELKKK